MNTARLPLRGRSGPVVRAGLASLLVAALAAPAQNVPVMALDSGNWPSGTSVADFYPGNRKDQSAPGQAVTPRSDSAVEVVHTGDWEPGDKVSFTVTGRVVDEAREKKANADFKGSVVRMTDSEGKSIHLPWSPLIVFRVPRQAVWMKAELIRPDGSKAGGADIPVNPPNTRPDFLEKGQTGGDLHVPSVIQSGQSLKIYSPPGKLDGIAANSLLATAGGKSPAGIALTPMAESPHSAFFDAKGLPPGPQDLVFYDPAAGRVNFRAQVMELKVTTEKIYKVGQSGDLRVEAGPFPLEKDMREKLLAGGLRVEILNKTPGILDFKSGLTAVDWNIQKKDVKNGIAVFKIPCRANKTGDFVISSRIKTPPYHDATTGGGAYYAPGGKPCLTEGDLIHIDQGPNGGPGRWLFQVDFPDGTKGMIIVNTTEKPPRELKHCQWIKVKRCAPDPDDPEGPAVLEEWDLIDDPTKEPAQPPVQPPAPTPPAPPEETAPPPPPPQEPRPPEVVVPPPSPAPPCQPVGNTRTVSAVVTASLIAARITELEEAPQSGRDCTASLQAVEFGAAGSRHVPTLARFFAPGTVGSWLRGRDFYVQFRVSTTTITETCTPTGWVQSPPVTAVSETGFIKLGGSPWDGTESPADLANAIRAARNGLGDPR